MHCGTTTRRKKRNRGDMDAIMGENSPTLNFEKAVKIQELIKKLTFKRRQANKKKK